MYYLKRAADLFIIKDRKEVLKIEEILYYWVRNYTLQKNRL